VAVTHTLKVALALLLVASTLNRWFPASYSAIWIETVSAATVGVNVLVGVGSTRVGVTDAPVAVGRGCVAVLVGVGPARVAVGVDSALVAVG
jgi:hypothetical protein